MDVATLMSVLGMSSGSQVNPRVASGLGIAQLLTGVSQQRKANKMYPDVPPMYYEMLNDYKRKARNTAVGGLYSSLMGKTRDMLAQGSNAVMQTGNPMAYAYAQRKGAGMMNDLLASMVQQRMGYEQMAGNMGNMVGNMRFQLDTNKWGNMQQKANTNIRSGIDNVLLGTIGSGMGKQEQAPTTGTMMTKQQMASSGMTPELLEALQKYQRTI